MTALKALALGASALALAGCADVDKVLFVTDTAIGINVDSKPATASIGYDRNEGYFGPRYENGAAPPVVASLETGGNVFNPKVRQLYATGQAAVKAVDGEADDGPSVLTPDTGRKLMVFGTSTNFGLKVGFGTGAYPDSFAFGYKRKEMSWIPLGVGQAVVKGKDASGHDAEVTVPVHIYPSVLGTIDTTIGTTGSVEGTGLTSRQFFATGQAAEALAVEQHDVFFKIANRAVAEAAGAEVVAATDSHLDKIGAFIVQNGALVPARLKCLTDGANAPHPPSPRVVVPDMSGLSPAQIRSTLETAPTLAQALAAQIDTCKAGENG